MINLRSFFVVVLVFILTAGSASAEETLEIRPQWEVGKRYNFHMTIKQDMTMPMGQETMNATMDMESIIHSDVREGEQTGHRELTLGYDRMMIAMDMGAMGQMSYDTNDPDPDSPFAGLDAFMKASISLSVDESGEIVSMAGLDAAIEAAAQGNPQMAQMLEGMLSEEMMTEMANGGIAELPQEQLQIGESWDFEQNMDMGGMGNMLLDGSYKLTGFEEHMGYDCGVLENSADIEFAMEKQGSNMSVESSNMSGTLYYARDLQMTVDSQITTDMVMSMQNPQTGEQMEMVIKQTMQQTLQSLEDL